MIKKAKERCKSMKSVTLKTANVLDIEFQKADLIVAYYTVQFIKPKNRQLLFDRIYQSLNWGGAFLLFEKVRSSDARFQDMMTTIYTDYKIDQGYSSDEIVGKTRSLKGVLEPFSTQGNRDLLTRAGFVDILTVMKYVSFEGFLAIK
jgi:tRNA (cmo5U34)-methyltransferase